MVEPLRVRVIPKIPNGGRALPPTLDGAATSRGSRAQMPAHCKEGPKPAKPHD